MTTPKKIHDIDQGLAHMRVVAAHAAHAYKTLRREGLPAKHALELTKAIISAATGANRTGGDGL